MSKFIGNIGSYPMSKVRSAEEVWVLKIITARDEWPEVRHEDPFAIGGYVIWKVPSVLIVEVFAIF